MELVDRKALEEREDRFLAPYGMRSARSRGRRHLEPDDANRTRYQRDRDRVIHSSSFRRLEYKTQVFVNHEGDNYRTRLTHSLEGAQIGRSVARSLALNEDLTECLVLGHDLGHTPFGHSGEKVMAELMADHGGFEHNRQTLRILEVLEERYPKFPGLNLTWEIREGIIKHQPDSDARAPAEYAPGEAPTLEAQLVDFVDEIAYNNHDIDDGLSSGMITVEKIRAVELFRDSYEEVRAEGIRGERLMRHQTVRRIISRCTKDLVETTLKTRPRRERGLRRRRAPGGPPPRRLLAGHGAPGEGAEGVPLHEPVPPLPRGAHGGQGGPRPARPVPVLRRGAAAAPAALPGADPARRRAPRGVRLHRGDDRPLRGGRAPEAVRSAGQGVSNSRSIGQG